MTDKKMLEEQMDMDAIMSTEAGRNVLLSLLEEFGYFDNDFSVDPARHAYNSGLRGAALIMVQKMQDANPHKLANILKEHFNVDQ